MVLVNAGNICGLCTCNVAWRHSAMMQQNSDTVQDEICMNSGLASVLHSGQ